MATDARNSTKRIASSSAKLRSAASIRTVVPASTARRERATSRRSAAAPVRADARKSPPRTQPASDQTGWFETARSTPVYPATKKPSPVPITFHTAPTALRANAPSGANTAPRNDTNEKRPKPSSAQEPTDIGDQYLKERPPSLALSSMFVNRSGVPRSAMRKTGHGMSAMNDTMKAMRAAR